MLDQEDLAVPEPGHWPVDPQEDVPISKDRIWIDGCFDFSHHGTKVLSFQEAWNVSSAALIFMVQDMREQYCKHVDLEKNY